MALNYRRGYNWEQQEYVPAPVGGWAPDAPAWELADTQAQQLDNFLIRPGKIVLRGSFKVRADFSTVGGLAPALPLNLAGVVFGDGPWLLLGRKSFSGGGFIDPWNAHIFRTSDTTKLAAPVAQVLWVDTQAGTVTTLDTTGDPAQVPGMRWVGFNGKLYGLCYADTLFGPLDCNGGYKSQATRLRSVVPGATTPTGALGNMATGPVGGIDLAAHLDRLFVLGGAGIVANTVTTNPGGLTNSSTTLFYTRPIESLTNATSDWTDPVSGLTNKLTIDEDYMNPGVALARTQAGLLIFRRNSIHILRGSVPANFQEHVVTREVGCVDARSVVETDGGVYFISHRGCMWTDGNRVRNISGVMQERLNVLLSTYLTNVRAGAGGYATVAQASDGQLVITIGADDQIGSLSPTGHAVTLFSALFDPATNTWTRITSDLWHDDAISLYSPNVLAAEVYGRSGRMYVIGDRYLTELEDLTKSPLGSENGRAGHGANAPIIGTVVWANPNGITYPPSVDANAALPKNGSVSHYLFATQFGCAIPAAATVLGVQAVVWKHATGVDSSSGPIDNSIKLLKAAAVVGTEHATTAVWPSTWTSVSYGGPTDLWGTGGLLPADVNASGFGVAISAKNPSTKDVVVSVGSPLTMIVYYELAGIIGASAVSSFVRMYDGFDYPLGATPLPVPALWQSRLVRLGTLTRKQGQLREVYFDYLAQATQNTPTGGWSVDFLDAAESSLLGAQALGVIANPGVPSPYDRPRPVPNLQRTNCDVARQTVDGQFRLTWNPTRNAGGSPVGLLAEIHGAGLEFQPTSDIR